MQATTAKPAKPPRIREPKPEQPTPRQVQTSESAITGPTVVPVEPPPGVSVPELDAINASRHAVRQPPGPSAYERISNAITSNFGKLERAPLNADPQDPNRVLIQIGIACKAIDESVQLSTAEKSALLMNLRSLYLAAELAGKVPQETKLTCRRVLLGAQYKAGAEQTIREFLSGREGRLMELANLIDPSEFKREASGLVAQIRSQPVGEQPALLIHLARHLRELADARPEMKLAVATVMADKFNVADQTKLSFLAPADRQALEAIVAPFLVLAKTFSYEKILGDITHFFGPTEEIKGEPAPSDMRSKVAKTQTPSELGLLFTERIEAALLPPREKIHLYDALLRGMEALGMRKGMVEGIDHADLIDAYDRMLDALTSVGPLAANDIALRDKLTTRLQINLRSGVLARGGLF